MTSIQYLAISEIIDPGKSSKNKEREKYWSINLDQIESHTGKVTSWDFLNINEIGPSTHFFEKGTVLYSKLRPYLNKVVLADRDGYATTELVPIRCNVKIALPEYVAYFLRSPKFLKFAENLVAGAKMPRMVMSEFWKYKIPVPSLAEQRRIAAILDKAEALRAKRREAIAKLDQLLQSVFVEMFGDGGKSDYQILNLEQVCTKITDGAHFTPTYINDNSGIPFLRVTDIHNELINWNDVKRIPLEEHLELLKRCRPERGDVLYSKNGTIGVSKIIDWEDEFSIFVSLCLLKPNKQIINGDYLDSFLKTSGALEQAKGRTKTGTVSNLHLTEIKKVKIPVPPLNIQEIWQRKSLNFKNKKELMNKSLEKLDFLINSIQKEFFI